MKKHFKTRIVEGLASTCANFKPLPPGSARRARGVRYFSPVLAIKVLWGAMDLQSEGRQHKKHVIVRRTHCRQGLLQLYVYRFPKQWSAACQENRAIQAVARRRAHDLEHDYSRAALEYRIRFLSHYFRVFKGGEKPAEGMKPYSRFFHYTYVYILRELYAAQARQQAKQEEEVTFVPVISRKRGEHIYPLGGVSSGWGPRESLSRGRITPKGLFANIVSTPRSFVPYLNQCHLARAA